MDTNSVATQPASMAQVMRRALVCVRRFWPAILVAYLTSLALVLPLAAVVTDALEQSIGASPVGMTLREGFDPTWYRGFSSHHQGVAGSFSPAVSGAGAVLGALDRLITGGMKSLPLPMLLAISGYAGLWVVLSAGVMGQYARPDENPGFFSAIGEHLSRFLMLFAVVLAVYAGAFVFLLPQLSDLVEALNRDTIDERIHFAWVAGKYALFWTLLWFVHTAHDYAKALTVLRPELQLAGLLVGTLRMYRANLPRLLGLAATTTVLASCGVVLAALLSPGAGQSSATMIVLALLVGQLFIVLRILLRCFGLATKVVFVASLDPGQ